MKALYMLVAVMRLGEADSQSFVLERNLAKAECLFHGEELYEYSEGKGVRIHKFRPNVSLDYYCIPMKVMNH